MKELTQVKQAVMDALRDAGMAAVETFPAGGARAYAGAVAAVSVGTVEGKAMSFCDYLGEVYDETAGTMRERYGRRLEGEICVDIRAALAADCETGCQQAAETLLGGLPAGIRPGELRWEPVEWEKSTGMFLRKGRLQCQAVFVAEYGEDGEVFLDFILKGELEK